MVSEKQEKLMEKSDALVQCQTDIVKTLSTLAQVMKEKMDGAILIEEGRRTMETLMMKVEEKEIENQNLRSQLPLVSQLREQLRSYQEELHLIKEESNGLRERLTRQQKEFEQQKTMVSHLSTVGQPLITSTPVVTAEVTAPSTRVLAAFWDWEDKGAAPREFFQLYESQ